MLENQTKRPIVHTQRYLCNKKHNAHKAGLRMTLPYLPQQSKSITEANLPHSPTLIHLA